LTDPLVLERKITKGKEDELDQMVNSLNATSNVQFDTEYCPP